MPLLPEFICLSGMGKQVLEFSKKEQMSFDEWTTRQDKFQSFFGPGVLAKVSETKQAFLLALSHSSWPYETTSVPATCLEPESSRDAILMTIPLLRVSLAMLAEIIAALFTCKDIAARPIVLAQCHVLAQGLTPTTSRSASVQLAQDQSQSDWLTVWSGVCEPRA